MTVAALPALTLREVRVTAVEVPLRYVLGTSAAALRHAPLLLVDVQTEEGIAGCSYVFCYRRSGARAIAAVLPEAFELVVGQPVVPLEIAALFDRRFALIGVTGVVRMALSALDMALWDALAIAARVPLATLLGSAPRPLRAYNSCGLGLMSPEAAADEAERLLEGGFQAMKLRLGHASLSEDLAATRAVRKRLPDSVLVMADYNQALSVAQALERGRALQSEGVTWLEEPIRHDDYRGNAQIARALELPLQLGENFNGPLDMEKALDAAARPLAIPFEVVVVDDSSTDRTSEIARMHGARVIPVQHRQIAATRNAGAKEASGDMFVFVDADTTVTNAVIRAAIEAMLHGAAGGGCAFRFGGRLPLYGRLLEAVAVPLYRAAGLASGCFLFCTRDAFRAAGGFDESMFGAEEAAMSRALRRHGKFVVLRESVITSGRKLRAHSGREVLGTMVRLALSGGRSIRRREGLDIWYGKRRPDPARVRAHRGRARHPHRFLHRRNPTDQHSRGDRTCLRSS